MCSMAFNKFFLYGKDVSMDIDKKFDLKTFASIIDQSYDEIFIWDDNYTVLYANGACERHYGYPAKYFIGKTLDECLVKEKHWSDTSINSIYKEKLQTIQRMKTSTGLDIITISIPVLDDYGNVKYIIQTSRNDSSDLYRKLSPYIASQPSRHVSMVAGPDVSDSYICKSGTMLKIMEEAKRIARSGASLLLLGETGTGKSLMAKYIHQMSMGPDKPFVSINMASFAPTVLESELFGYKKGAFTGADIRGKKGYFENADGGTIFLDEIGEIPMSMQAKFLHVLQEKEVTPVGGAKPIKVDIRIISATNCDLRQMVIAGKFREDLYHRLNVFEITIPPLRNRPEDIPVLVDYFINIFNLKYNCNVGVSDETMRIFTSYAWRGNIRELSNIVERSILICEDNKIEPRHLPESFYKCGHSVRSGEVAYSEGLSFYDAMSEYEKYITKRVYALHKSSRDVARALKISQTKANRLIQKHIFKNAERAD